MRCLLDKVVARRILEGMLKLVEGRDLSYDEIASLDLYARAAGDDMHLFIVPSTDAVLRRVAGHSRYSALVEHFRSRTQVLFPTRYYKRWSRRLRGYGFTHEDASVLALGTFGTRSEADILGVDVIVTLDQPVLRQWIVQREALHAHLASMRRELPPPYNHAPFPKVLRPEEILPEALT